MFSDQDQDAQKCACAVSNPFRPSIGAYWYASHASSMRCTARCSARRLHRNAARAITAITVRRRTARARTSKGTVCGRCPKRRKKESVARARSSSRARPAPEPLPQYAMEMFSTACTKLGLLVMRSDRPCSMAMNSGATGAPRSRA